MKSIFDKDVREEVVNRISSLNEGSKAQWGVMTVAQMAKHCALSEEYYNGNINVKRSFLGRIFGKLAIAGVLKDEHAVFKKNSPTPPQLKVNDADLNLKVEKERWKELIIRYGNYPHDHFIHWFFGDLTKKQLGEFIYKHADHHLRQFSA